jgi:hypothetical protein
LWASFFLLIDLWAGRAFVSYRAAAPSCCLRPLSTRQGSPWLLRRPERRRRPIRGSKVGAYALLPWWNGVERFSFLFFIGNVAIIRNMIFLASNQIRLHDAGLSCCCTCWRTMCDQFISLWKIEWRMCMSLVWLGFRPYCGSVRKWFTTMVLAVTGSACWEVVPAILKIQLLI